jgi:hypothetical protein
MNTQPNRQQLEELTAQELDTLRRELGSAVSDERITAVGREQFERLVEQATVTDFIPLFVYRATKAVLIGNQVDPQLKKAA